MKENPKSLASVNFIIGIGRSGTTLLTSILNSHSQIYANPENNFLLFLSSYLNSKSRFTKNDINYINKILSLNTNTTLTVWRGEVKSENFPLSKDEVIQKIYMSSSIQSGKKKVLSIYDKNPEYTLQIRLLKKLIPNSKFIGISRNYLDNIASRKKFGNQRKKGIIKSELITTYMLAISWNYYNKKIIRMLGSDKFFHIKYEDLVSSPAETLTKLFTFIGLTYEDQVLNYHKDIELSKKIDQSQLSENQKAAVKSMHKNLEKPIFSKRIGVWQEQLSEKERIVCDVICAKSARTLGYKQDKAFSIWQQVFILTTSTPLKMLYQIYLFFKDLKYYKLPLSIRILFFKK